MKKRYLGDGVYAAFDGYMVVLTTENGYRVTNTVCLEPEVVEALEQYLADLRASLVAVPAASEGRDG